MRRKEKGFLNVLFMLYIMLLPFPLIHVFEAIKNFFSKDAAITNNIFLLILGLLLYLGARRFKVCIKKNNICCLLLELVLFLMCLSFVTSLILFLPFGSLYGETTITTSGKRNIYLGLIGLTFYFNYILFHKLSIKTIKKILSGMSVFNLIIGFLQLLIIYNYPYVSEIYDSIDIFNVLVDSTRIKVIHRVCFVGVEPSSASGIVNVLLLPYIMSMTINERHRIRYYILMGTYVFLEFFTLSSTVYVALLINFTIYIYILIKKEKKYYLFLLMLFVLIMIPFAWTFVIKNTYFGTQIEYFLITKIFGGTDASSTYRYTTVINDIVCFLMFPITGIGNGNQGFLFNYSLNLPWVDEIYRSSEQAKLIMSGKAGVVTGGAFFPAFLSGYGLLGMMGLFLYIRKCVHSVEKYQEHLGNFRYMYYMGGITFLVISIVSSTLEGNFLALFVCSIPLMTECIAERRENYNCAGGQYAFEKLSES